MENWYGIQSALLAAIICAALAINVLLRTHRPGTYRPFLMEAAWSSCPMIRA